MVGWVGSTTSKVLKISNDYVNAFKARLDKMSLRQAVKLLAVLCWVGLSQSADGFGCIGSHKWTHGQLYQCASPQLGQQADPDWERKCADTTGIVLVPWAGHFQC